MRWFLLAILSLSITAWAHGCHPGGHDDDDDIRGPRLPLRLSR